MKNQRRGGDNPESPDRLKKVFQIVVAGGRAQSDWAELWQTMLDDPWLRVQVASRAKRFVASSGLEKHVSEDVAQQVLVLLAAKLAADPSLHAKAELLPESFDAWMGTILDHACGEAARMLGAFHPAHANLSSAGAPLDEWPAVQRRLDVAAAVTKLEGQQRSVMLLYLRGCTREEIAAELDLSYKQVAYAIDAAKRKLKRWLKDYGPDEP